VRHGVRPNEFAHPGAVGCAECDQGPHSVHNVWRGVNRSVIGWVVVAVGAWSAVALAVGILVGRAIRLRDRQVPRSADLRISGIPAPRRAPDESLPDAVPGRGPRRDPELRGR
jgi:hypothetical protein